MHSSTASAERSRPLGLRKHYDGLDLIRGIAAIAVLVYHVDFMFGLRGSLLTGGYLAVDLFFILSGFVIASNYEGRVSQGTISMRVFATRRITRLYPLYALTLVAGLFIMTARYTSQHGYLDAGPLLISAFSNALLIPSFARAYGSDVLYPFNAASWSIFYEVFINAVFFLLLAQLKTRRLLIIWGASSVALAMVAWRVGNIDVGWAIQNFISGFARVTFSFLSGMLIWRAHSIRPWRSSSISFAALLVVTLILMQVHKQIPSPLLGVVDLCAIITLLPALVISGVGVEFSTAYGNIAKYLGNISYSVYLIQGPLIIAAAGTTQKLLGTKIYNLDPVAGFVFVPLCIALSTVCFYSFEKPTRALFRSRAREPRARLN